MYPSKETIVKGPLIKFPESTLRTVAEWKKKWYIGWKDKTKKDQIEGIIALLRYLAINEGHQDAECIKGTMYGYSKSRNVILLDKDNPSIISALHELAHSFYGDSEAIACRWSTHLFQVCFPKSYSKLQFKGHKLVKK